MWIRLLTVPTILLAAAVAADAAGPGDPAAGKAYFTEMCIKCHSAEPGDGGGEIGPSLVGVFGRAAGVGDNRFDYSQALKNSGLVWNARTLDHFLADPATAVPGTTMPLPIPSQKDRDNVIAYFQSLAAAR